METKNEVAMHDDGIAVMVEKEPRAIKFVAWFSFEDWVADDLMHEGRTRGAHNRRWMHKKLDEFIDSL